MAFEVAAMGERERNIYKGEKKNSGQRERNPSISVNEVNTDDTASVAHTAKENRRAAAAAAAAATSRRVGGERRGCVVIR